MKDFPVKANITAGDDTGSPTGFGANEFNSLAIENETAVTSTGQTLTAGVAADTKTDQLARALVIAGQSASSYNDSGAANAYVLTKAVSGLVQPENYFDGMRVSFIPDNANTGASTINVSTLGSKAIRTVSDAGITSGVLLATKIYNLVYISSFNSGAGAFVVTDDKASTTNKGSVELATSPEAVTGTDTAKAVTPSGVKAAIDAGVSAWVYPTLNTGWVNSGGDNVGYRYIDNGNRVEIAGQATSTGASATIFTLGVGYRPTYEKRGVIVTGSTPLTYSFEELFINADGTVTALQVADNPYYFNNTFPIT